MSGTRGHWRSTETISDQELKAVTCTARVRAIDADTIAVIERRA
jgi:hypothetical protein